MGGYGGASGRIKEKCYYDSGGHKVTDQNAITVGEYYIKQGKYVVFLQEKDGQKRADLSVDGQHIEVKGLETMNPDNVEGKLKHAYLQVDSDNFRYPSETHRKGKVVILSKHNKSIPEKDIYNVMYKGFLSAKNKGYVTGELELWINGNIYYLN